MTRKTYIWLLIAMIAMVFALLHTLGDHKQAGSANKELIIFHAGSLSVPFRQVSAEFEKMHPDIVVKAEAAGSRACARKISDLDRQCDIMASADYKVVANLLMPEYANFNIHFALNEMVIAYTAKSRRSEKITADNWHEILLEDDVAFGRSDPDLDPCGYRTLMVFQLAEKHYELAGIAKKLKNKDQHIRPKENDLLALLEVGEIDYLFIYRSVATQHELDMILLPDRINLKSREHAEFYKTAVVEVSGKKPGEIITRTGEPMVYSVTICKEAPNPEAAEAWLAFLLSEKGRAIMEKNGQPCIKPAIADGLDRIPETLKQFCE